MKLLPAPTVSWGDFRQAHPDGSVLGRETGERRDYGKTPYAGYDTGRPFLYRGARDDRLPMMERVLIVTEDDLANAVAFPFTTLEEERVVNHQVGGEPVAVFYRKGTASPVDATVIAEGRDIGAAVAYRRKLGIRTFTFEPTADGFRDNETGTEWSFLGRGVKGPLEGQRLERAVHFVPFWFAWAAFHPDTPVYGGRHQVDS